MTAGKASEETKHPNKPGGSRFQQQTLAAWKPVYSAKCVIPIFFVFGVIFIPLGVIFFLESSTVKEKTLDYSNCVTSDNVTCSEFRKNRTQATMAMNCMCTIDFELTESWAGPVYVYYRLTEFYQNHRRYLKSVNQEQLLGDVGKTSGCTPHYFQSGTDPNNVSLSGHIVPCGMIANSKFNDTFTLTRSNSSGGDNTNVTWHRTGIAWSEDIKYKFANPSDLSAFDNTVRPDYWQQSVQDLTGKLQNEDLAVWMRTAALPKFRKLYARIPNGLTAGNYSIGVGYNFPLYRGNKNVVLSTAGWLGGKNRFLGIAYLTVGGLAIAGGCVLLAVYLAFRKKKKSAQVAKIQ